MRDLLLTLILFFPLFAVAEDARLSNVLMVQPMYNVPVKLIDQQLAHIKKTNPAFDVKFPLLPTFKLATRAYMKNLYERLSGEKTKTVVAMYVHYGKNTPSMTLYLPIDWDINNREHRANLYHELVHYIQYMNDFDSYVKCEKVLEYHAYTATATYLIEVEGLAELSREVQLERDAAVSDGTCP